MKMVQKGDANTVPKMAGVEKLLAPNRGLAAWGGAVDKGRKLQRNKTWKFIRLLSTRGPPYPAGGTRAALPSLIERGTRGDGPVRSTTTMRSREMQILRGEAWASGSTRDPSASSAGRVGMCRAADAF